MKTLRLTTLLLISLMLFSCNMQPDCHCDNEPSTPKNLITYEKAFEQLGNYDKAHPRVRGNQYALRTWVSIEELENYIAYAKAEGKKNNIKVNGIDFIYTQYKEAKAGLPNESNKDYELTFMYAPTYRDTVNDKNEAFDPMNSKPGDPAKLRERLKFKNPKASKDSANEQTTPANSRPSGPSGIANNVQTCPTVCP